MLEGQSGDQQHNTTANDDLGSLSTRTLADAGCSRGRVGRTVGRIDRLEDAHGPGADADDPVAANHVTTVNAPGQPPSDASRYITVYMKAAKRVVPPGQGR